MVKKHANEEEIVLKFLTKENRPFSVQNIVDALQKQNVKKTGVERSLASLVSKEKVVKKEYGKAKIFIIRQDTIQVPDEQEMKSIDDDIKNLTLELDQTTTRTDKLKDELGALKNQLTLEQAKERDAKLQKELSKKEAKRQSLGDGSKLMSKEDKFKMEQTYYNLRSLWKKYKRIINDVTDQIGEATGKKNKELYEEMCIETDEDMDIKISDFPEIQNPSKVRRLSTNNRPFKRHRQK